MLEVARRLNEAGVDFRFSVVGDGPLRQQLNRQAHEFGLAERVEFPGFVSQETLDHTMRSSDVILLLSESEGFGLSVLEAMNYGCIPIVTDTCGCKEAIREGASGFVVRLGDVQSVVERVRLLDQDRKRLACMSAEAIRTVQEDYSWEREVARHLEVLRLAQEHHQRHAAQTVPWQYEPPTLMNQPWVPNWLACGLRRARHLFAAPPP